jgi:hypothetical protein
MIGITSFMEDGGSRWLMLAASVPAMGSAAKTESI